MVKNKKWFIGFVLAVSLIGVLAKCHKDDKDASEIKARYSEFRSAYLKGDFEKARTFINPENRDRWFSGFEFLREDWMSLEPDAVVYFGKETELFPRSFENNGFMGLKFIKKKNEWFLTGETIRIQD